MFQALEEMFKAFFQTVGELISYVLGVFDDIAYVVKLLGTVTLRLPDLFGWLPDVCISIILTTFSIVVIYKVLGREG